MMERIFISYKENLISLENESKKRLLAIEYQNKFTALGEMIGNISHQWKQPLNTLNIAISKLQLFANENKLEKDMLLKSLNRMEYNISFLSRTIDLFRDFFKRSSVCEMFELNSLIENILFIIQDSFTTKDIDIITKLDSEVMIFGDRLKLEQAILNILNNAKDALITNRSNMPRIVIETKSDSKYATIVITDNGGGVDKEIIDKVFDLYFTTKDKLDGTGFGLYLVKTIVENDFNGDIWCRNSENGAVFTIKIPIYM
jgi:signal transduction histidine kinase